MATSDKPYVFHVELTPLEKAWVVQSCMTQRNVLSRARGKEIVGSEIWSLRGRELDALNALITKVGG